ncbi:class I SAM-dependent methyltransferase [Hymenobacter aquaticus]|nr:class I SAM-dependent methyltransferase [Hymenobacter aquaticus]
MLVTTKTIPQVQSIPKPGGSLLAPPHTTLLTALQLFEAEAAAPRSALDLGCGSGADTLELLNRHWHVVAVDSAPEALATVLTQAPVRCMARLTTKLTAFEDLQASQLPPFDLVNASFSLPYCAAAHFGQLWTEVRQMIRRNGRFCGHFLGLSDDANKASGMSLHSLPDVFALFAGFEVEMLNGVETDKAQSDGSVKHSHVISVVARKK